MHVDSLVQCPTSVAAVQFPSSTATFGVLTLQSAAFAAAVLIRMHGIATGASSSATPWRTLRTIDGTTDNTWWCLFFAASALNTLGVTLAVALTTGGSAEVIRRGATLAGRLTIVLCSALLTVALNHHRIHRLRDYSSDNTAVDGLERQAKYINRFTAAVYVAYSVGETIAASVITHTAAVDDVFLYVYIAAVTFINLPNVFAALWIVVHDAELKPSKAAAACLMTGVALRFVAIYPAALWNDHLLKRFVDATPCPLGGYASFYDGVSALMLVAHSLIIAFVVLEFRRCQLAQYRAMSNALGLEYMGDSVSDVGVVYSDSNFSLDRSIQHPNVN
jgi:hypothetical protein